MLTKNELKYYSSLLQKKNRTDENKFLAEGKKIVEEAFVSGFKAELLFCTKVFYESNLSFINSFKGTNVRIEILKNAEFDKLTDTKNPQGIAAVFSRKEIKSKPDWENNLIVALENISDPGNLGTIIRNCDWFGINEIIINKNCAEIFSPKVIRASMGSVFHLNIYEENDFIISLSRAKEKKYEIVTADLNGDSLYDFKTSKKIIIVFCNEANGPSEELLKITDRKITIPGKGKAESLNVASASAVILSEVTK